MDLGLREKVAVITGGSRGIGKACLAGMRAYLRAMRGLLDSADFDFSLSILFNI
jgi:hypothetical protein